MNVLELMIALEDMSPEMEVLVDSDEGLARILNVTESGDSVILETE